MIRIDELIAELRPSGVPFKTLSETTGVKTSVGNSNREKVGSDLANVVQLTREDLPYNELSCRASSVER